MAQILVIDDNADLRAFLEQVLTPAGHKVILAADGKEGVKQCRASTVNLVITDLFMPNQEGLETIVELHKDFPQVTIIAMSGRSSASTMLSIARRLGAVAVLEKPFQSEQLLSEVERALHLA
jgi:DNA-binding NtrC family response regulator